MTWNDNYHSLASIRSIPQPGRSASTRERPPVIAATITLPPLEPESISTTGFLAQARQLAESVITTITKTIAPDVDSDSISLATPFNENETIQGETEEGDETGAPTDHADHNANLAPLVFSGLSDEGEPLIAASPLSRNERRRLERERKKTAKEAAAKPKQTFIPE